jgi:hypothetical protein
MNRLIEYSYTLSKYGIKINGNTSVLAGARELWANIDGISPITRDKLIKAYKTKANLDTLDVFLPVGEDKTRIEEGKEYLKALAESSGIKLDPTSPFIQYKPEECPAGRFPNRIYPNYSNEENQKLTETLMSQDLIATYHASDINVIDTVSNYYQRPNTSTTANDAATKFVKRIIQGEFGKQKEFSILFQTNNPYIERQTIAAQQEVNKVLEKYKLSNEGYSIKVNGIGFACKQCVATIHSEFAALVAEKWKEAIAKAGAPAKLSIEDLQFQSRDNSQIFSEHPDVSEVNLSGSLLQDFFDKYLP